MTYILKEGVICFILTKDGLESCNLTEKRKLVGTTSAIHLTRQEFNGYIHGIFMRKNKEITFDVNNIVEAFVIRDISDDVPYHATLINVINGVVPLS